MEKFIIHCDMNNYFASIEMLNNPYLELIPLVVCGDIELRHGIVLSKNNEAKKYGIVTGESVYDAKKKYKDVVCIKANYKKYMHYTKLSREIYHKFTDLIYPYSLDEAWLDISMKCSSIDEALNIARIIKKTIKEELGLNISIGLSFNFVFAKLASDKKDGDVFVIDQEHFIEQTKNIPAFELLFVGNKTRSKLKKLNILTIGDLRKSNVSLLTKVLGKKGKMLYDFSCGDDSSFIPNIENTTNMKSISNTITAPKDIYTLKETEKYIYLLSVAISKRLKKHNLVTKTISLKIKLNDFKIIGKQLSMDNYSNDTMMILKGALKAINLLEYDLPIRSITLRVNNLKENNYTQMSLFLENDGMKFIEKEVEIKNNFDEKYKKFAFEEGSNLKDWDE